MIAGLIFSPENRFPFKPSCDQPFQAAAQSKTREFHLEVAFSYFLSLIY